ncbi:MAG: hypothetical protein JNL30_06915 [Rubrivivax sp.]|nr:hypothetical protein [Rubrivivax sp.]
MRSASVAAACLWLLGPTTAMAQAALPGAVRASFAEGWVATDEVLVLELAASVAAQRSRLRLFVGRHDLSALMRMPAPGRLEVGGNLAWDSGETEVVLYLAEAPGWRELGRWPLRVRTAAGFESSQFEPRLESRIGGRALQRRSDGAPVTPRGTYAEAGARGGVNFTGKREGWQLEAAAQVQAATFRGEALRFSTLGAFAPRVDLAEYRLAAAHGGWRVQLGHAEVGQHPLLMNAFAARGVGLRAPLGAGIDVALSVTSGSTLVGYDNLSGVEERQHRIQGAVLGAELAKDWRIELSGLDARQEPRPDFGAGTVADRERSQGLGWRLHGKAAAGRLRLDAAWARSRHEHPFDAALARDGQLAAVQPATRDAHRIDVQADLITADSATTTTTTTDSAPPADTGPTLTLGLQHERSAPLYRSLAATVSGDQQQARGSATTAYRGASLVLSAAQREDNLGRIATLLGTRTQERSANLALPLPRWLGEASVWPQLALSAQRTHQFALNTPALNDSGFAATHRPDQVTLQQQLQLNWSLAGGATLAAGTTRSSVDNRQTGREQADFATLAHQLSLGLPLGPTLRAQLGGQRSRQLARESGLTGRSEAANLQLDWQPTPRWVLGGQLSAERSEQAAQAALQLQLARRFEWVAGEQKLPGQVSVRASAQQSQPSEAAAGSRLRQGWVDIGLSLNLP